MSYSRGIFPLISSTGTLFSAAGAALFAANKILIYLFEEEENIPDIVKIITYLAVISSNFIVMSDTRVTTICRRYIKELYASDHDDESLPSESVIVVRPTQLTTNASINEFIPNTVHHLISVNVDNANQRFSPTHLPDNATRFQEGDEDTIEIQSSACLKQFARLSYHTLCVSGFLSTLFSAVSSYLGAITFFEFIGGDPSKQSDHDTMLALMILMHVGALTATACKFQANYTYNYPAVKHSAAKFSQWITKDNHEASRTTRCYDLKKYLVTMGLCSLNIISSPFLAYYSTTQTLYKIPYVKDYKSFIDIFSACSSITAVTSTILSTAPAVRESLEKWWYAQEEDSQKINAVYNANLLPLKIWNNVIFIAGAIDSLSTGANNCVSIVHTSHDVFNVPLYNIGLIVLAGMSGLSAIIVNAAFSVRRGHRAFLKNEVYDFYLRKGYILPAFQASIINNGNDLQNPLLEAATGANSESLTIEVLDEDNHIVGLSSLPIDISSHPHSSNALDNHSLLRRQGIGFFSAPSPITLQIHNPQTTEAANREAEFGIFSPN